MIIFEEELKYGVWMTAKEGTLGWHKEFKNIEEWCKENCIGKFTVVQPTPLERVFVFNEEADAIAMKLVWA